MRTTGHVEFLKFQSVMWAERIFIYEFKHLQVGTICAEKNVFQVRDGVKKIDFF